MWIVAITSTGPSTLGSTCADMIASGCRPITRAAWTYSLLRSTSVEPRTVRAYCTQPDDADREDQHVDRELVVRVRAAARRARRRRSAARSGSPGSESWTSATRMMNASSRAADVARDEAERDAERPSRTRPRRAPTSERDARAVDDRREHVAALVVGAEQVAAGCRRSVQAGGVNASSRLSVCEVERVVRRDPGREQRAPTMQIERRSPRRRSSAASGGSCRRCRCRRSALRSRQRWPSSVVTLSAAGAAASIRSRGSTA